MKHEWMIEGRSMMKWNMNLWIWKWTKYIYKVKLFAGYETTANLQNEYINPTLEGLTNSKGKHSIELKYC